MIKVYTIGAYGESEQQFFEKLIANKIDLFIDIRRRRAARGSKYSFVNSIKLQQKLNDLSIKYKHILELAPTNSIRELQKKDDFQKGINKKERTELGELFIKEYKKQILDKYDVSRLINQVDEVKFSCMVLFCVEKFPNACHRSIVADRIQQEFNIQIQNL